MRILIACDSFKGSLSAKEVAYYFNNGIKSIDKKIEVQTKLIADGGEGTLEAIVEANQGKYYTVEVENPIGERIMAKYGVIHQNIAVIEIAQAIGLPLLPETKRNPLYSSSYGCGQLIMDAYEKGCKEFIIGLGGTATNDGGIGLLQALGMRFLKKDRTTISKNILAFNEIDCIIKEEVDDKFRDCVFHLATDVHNFLLGEQGATAIFGPQKGIKKNEIVQVDQMMKHYKEKMLSYYKVDEDCEGDGAAGGIGFALRLVCNTHFTSGIELISKMIHLDEAIQWSDVVITGEGKLDRQTLLGKAPYGVMKRARQFDKKVIAIAGCIDCAESVFITEGFQELVCINTHGYSLTESMKQAPRLVYECAQIITRKLKENSDG